MTLNIMSPQSRISCFHSLYGCKSNYFKEEKKHQLAFLTVLMIAYVLILIHQSPSLLKFIILTDQTIYIRFSLLGTTIS